MESKIVRLLQPGTVLSALNDQDVPIEGLVEKYVFTRYTDDDGKTSYVIKYLVRWTDGVYEYIPWSECDEYNPVRPLRTPSAPQGFAMAPHYPAQDASLRYPSNQHYTATTLDAVRRESVSNR